MLAVEANAQQLLAATEAMLPLVREHAAWNDRERRIAPAVVQALAESGVCRMLAPRGVGGLEVDPVTQLEVIYQLSRADGSVGWVAQVHGACSYLTGLLPPETGQAIFGRDPRAVVSGTLAAPYGRAVVADGGYRVSGRWPYGSGCLNAGFLGMTAALHDASGPLLDERGEPRQRIVVVPAEEVTIHDTWRVTGLRGTASHDVELDDVFVPAAWTCWYAERQHWASPLYCARWWLLGHGAQRLGMARAAIDALVDLAQVKVPTRASALLRDRPLAQMQVAQAEALLESARRYLWDTTARLWERALAHNCLTLREQAEGRLANTHAALAAVQAVDLMYSAAGGSAIQEGFPLEQIFRDSHAAAQHAVIAPQTYEQIGQVLLHPDPESLPRPAGPPLL
jgi:alkylation response protein AidB-like acyl-CoA dehydrogenase